MKLLKSPLLLVVLLSMLPIVSWFLTTDLPHTHDGPVHLARMAAYFKALGDGQILPRWAGDLNYGYGLPLFNFIYHAPYLVSSVFLSLGFGLAQTFKIVAAVSFLVSGTFMYLFAKTFFKNEGAAFLVAILYQFAPFRLVELTVRGSLGELYTYAFLPLVLYSLVKLVENGSVIFFILTAVAAALLITSHNSISLVFFAAAALFVFVVAPKRKRVLLGFVALACGVLFSAFYWLPAIAEHKYTYGDLFMKELYTTHFVPLRNLLLPNVTNDPRLHVGGVSVQIGAIHLIAVATACFMFWKKRWKDQQEKKLVFFIVLIFATALFFMTEPSRPLWERVTLLRQFQFPWRLLSILTLTTALAGSLLLTISFFQKKSVYVSLIVATILATTVFWKPPLGFDRVTDEGQFWNYPLNTTYFGETDLIWSAGPAKGYPKAQAEIIEGDGSIQNISKRSNRHTYAVSAQSRVRLVDHTQYFPGWRVYVDGRKVPIEFQDQNWRGMITYFVEAGSHNVKVAFEKSKVQLFAEVLSLATLALLVGLWIFQKRVTLRFP